VAEPERHLTTIGVNSDWELVLVTDDADFKYLPLVPTENWLYPDTLKDAFMAKKSWLDPDYRTTPWNRSQYAPKHERIWQQLREDMMAFLLPHRRNRVCRREIKQMTSKFPTNG